ncbi:MAG TPA: DUF5666 domain-containing protein [Thermoanaerobaculia bacterium]|nr:DUF5666 domain-containing protein [Thermoanaerobaculia bacterium]
MTRRLSTMAVTAFAVVMLAGCASGGLGDIFGGSPASNELRGRVDYVDTTNRFVALTNVSGQGTMLSAGGGNTVRVYYDEQTPVEHQGRTYRPADLERGDEVAVQYDQSGNNIMARSMTVLHDVRSGTGTTPGGVYDSTIRGTVRHVDPARRTIEIDRAGLGSAVIEYDANTRVTFSGRSHRPEDLKRGDEIDIRVRDIGGGRLLAQDVSVLRSGSGTIGGTQASTVRGTVRFVDTSRREIGLEQTSWSSGFVTGTPGGSTMVVQYDANTSVEFGGSLYAPTNLERGDIIDVQVQNLGSGALLANRIVVVRDVNVR